MLAIECQPGRFRIDSPWARCSELMLIGSHKISQMDIGNTNRYCCWTLLPFTQPLQVTFILGYLHLLDGSIRILMSTAALALLIMHPP